MPWVPLYDAVGVNALGALMFGIVPSQNFHKDLIYIHTHTHTHTYSKYGSWKHSVGAQPLKTLNNTTKKYKNYLYIYNNRT